MDAHQQLDAQGALGLEKRENIRFPILDQHDFFSRSAQLPIDDLQPFAPFLTLFFPLLRMRAFARPVFLSQQAQRHPGLTQR